MIGPRNVYRFAPLLVLESGVRAHREQILDTLRVRQLRRNVKWSTALDNCCRQQRNYNRQKSTREGDDDSADDDDDDSADNDDDEVHDEVDAGDMEPVYSAVGHTALSRMLT